MSIYNEVGNRTIALADLDGSTNKGPTVGVWSGAGGTIVCVLANDPDGQDTTIANVPAGQWIPISIKEWVSGPVGAVGFAS